MTTKSAIRLGIISACVYALALPYVSQAQTDVRSQIRADLMADPRSAEMTEAELNTLVEALAVQAEEEGIAEDLTAETTFDFSELFAAQQAEETPIANPLSSPMAIALLALVSSLLLVVLYILRKRLYRRADLQNS